MINMPRKINFIWLAGIHEFLQICKLISKYTGVSAERTLGATWNMYTQPWANNSSFLLASNPVSRVLNDKGLSVPKSKLAV
jgi:hypothetical protein